MFEQIVVLNYYTDCLYIPTYTDNSILFVHFYGEDQRRGRVYYIIWHLTNQAPGSMYMIFISPPAGPHKGSLGVQRPHFRWVITP